MAAQNLYLEVKYFLNTYRSKNVLIFMSISNIVLIKHIMISCLIKLIMSTICIQE